MKKALGIIAIVGFAMILYNQYQESKKTKNAKIKT